MASPRLHSPPALRLSAANSFNQAVVDNRLPAPGRNDSLVPHLNVSHLRPLMLTHYTRSPEAVANILTHGFAWIPNRRKLTKLQFRSTTIRVANLSNSE